MILYDTIKLRLELYILLILSSVKGIYNYSATSSTCTKIWIFACTDSTYHLYRKYAQLPIKWILKQ